MAQLQKLKTLQTRLFHHSSANAHVMCTAQELMFLQMDQTYTACPVHLCSLRRKQQSKPDKGTSLSHLFPVVVSKRTKGNRIKLEHGRFHSKEKCFHLGGDRALKQAAPTGCWVSFSGHFQNMPGHVPVQANPDICTLVDGMISRDHFKLPLLCHCTIPQWWLSEVLCSLQEAKPTEWTCSSDLLRLSETSNIVNLICTQSDCLVSTTRHGVTVDRS